jgi:peptidylprolyl isomerase
VPRTAENYKQLLLGTGKYKERALSLVGTNISKHINRTFLQLGTMREGNCSIFGPTFRDESFELMHDRPGLLTSITEENTNNSRFAITLSPCPFMDLKNVVFGEVTGETFPNLREIEKLGPKALTLRILASELIKIKEHSEHGDEAAGHHGLKHKHGSH